MSLSTIAFRAAPIIELGLRVESNPVNAALHALTLFSTVESAKLECPAAASESNFIEKLSEAISKRLSDESNTAFAFDKALATVSTIFGNVEGAVTALENLLPAHCEALARGNPVKEMAENYPYAIRVLKNTVLTTWGSLDRGDPFRKRVENAYRLVTTSWEARRELQSSDDGLSPETRRQITDNKIAAAMLHEKRGSKTYGASGCWFGGEPTLPAEIPWPVFTVAGRGWNNLTIPMHFVAQLKCAELPEGLSEEAPRQGTLYFFYEPIFWNQTGGVGKVIYVSSEVSEINPRPCPTPPEIDYELLIESDGCSFLNDEVPVEPFAFRLPKAGFKPLLFETWPSEPKNEPSSVAYSDAITRFEREQRSALAKSTYPGVNDPTKLGMSCLFLGANESYEHKKEREWLALLFFPGFADFYFLIRRDDLKAQNFDNIEITTID